MKKLLLILLFLSIATSGFALDVNNKAYVLDNTNVYTVVVFEQAPVGPGSNGTMYLFYDNLLNSGYEYHQNPNDPIVNLGDAGVFYQSPSDVLTFIPPPFYVFKPVSYLLH